MTVSFVTPLGAVFALTAAVPLAFFVLRERTARRIRATLGLRHPSPGSRVSLVAALGAVAGLLALAAAQPVIESSLTIRERTDAEAFVVLDVSRSMLAAAGPDAPIRLDRARADAQRLRDRFPDVPFGLISMTDQTLPHLFPTTDERVFEATIEEAMGIERPPPTLFFSTQATSLDTLASIPTRKYYSASTRKRLLVVLTDGESRPLEGALARAFSRGPRIDTLLVHYWGADEGIYETGVPERAYQPMPASAGLLASVASAVDGQVFREGEVDALADAAAEALGTGPTRERVIEGERRALMPWVTLAALLPLGFVLLRRNV